MCTPCESDAEAEGPRITTSTSSRDSRKEAYFAGGEKKERKQGEGDGRDGWQRVGNSVPPQRGLGKEINQYYLYRVMD